MNCDIYESYEKLNDALRRDGLYHLAVFSEDNNVEQMGLIVGVRKWTWDNLGDGSECPDWPVTMCGFTFREHHKISDKYDVFIYERI